MLGYLYGGQAVYVSEAIVCPWCGLVDNIPRNTCVPVRVGLEILRAVILERKLRILDMVVHAHNPNAWEVEIGGSEVEGHPQYIRSSSLA